MSTDNWTTPVDPSAGTIVRADYITYSTQNIQALYNGLNGDASADSAMLHKHKTGTLAARPAPGNAGRIYIPSDLPIMLVDDGTDWQIGGPMVTGTDYFFNDLANGAADNWDTATGNNGTVTDTADSFSKTQLATSATSGGYAILRTRNLADMVPTNIFLCYMRVLAVDAASANQQIQCGLSSGFPGSVGNPVNGIYIRKTDAGNFFGISCSSSTEQETTDLGSTGATAIDVVIEGDGGTTAYFYVNGFKETASATGSVTTSLPTANLFLSFKIINSTTATRRLDVDAGMRAMAR